MSPVALATAERAADRVVCELCELHRDLSTCPNLRPGPEVDPLLTRLVHLVVSTGSEAVPAVLGHPWVRAIAGDLRAMAGAAEFELELDWAERIAVHPWPHAELAGFPYLDNYRELSRMESRAMAEISGRHPLRRVAFVGSGPLPLTSYFLVHEPGVTVDNLDRDVAAIEVSTRVAKVLDLEGVSFRTVDVGPGTDLSGYDLVVLAALVGSTCEEKRRVLAGLADSMAPGALLLVRSARGLRTLLYPAVQLDAFAGFDLLGVVHPHHDVINSVIVARKPKDR